jgi:FKBP-type peptidyl-prolyl cis-trans isomerase FkpA
MKKFILILLVISAAFSSCSKTDNAPPFDAAAQAVADDATIQAYLKANSLTATKDPSGLYYQIVTQGTGVNPTASSLVSVNYSGKYTDETVFDHGTLSKYQLGYLIQGWVIGLPYVKLGGRIILYIPSALAYGHNPSNGSRSDAVMIFTIDLTGVQ